MVVSSIRRNVLGKRAGQNARVTRLTPSFSYYTTMFGYHALQN